MGLLIIRHSFKIYNDQDENIIISIIIITSCFEITLARLLIITSFHNGSYDSYGTWISLVFTLTLVRLTPLK